jgi:hypothetical protein
MMTSHRRMLPLAAVEPVIGRAFAVRPDAQERAKGVERVEAAVKAEGELVEVGLQVLGADRAMVRAAEPSLQVAENQVDDGQELFGYGRVATLDHGEVLVSERTERVVAVPCVRDDHRARRDGRFHKSRQCLSAAIGHDFQAQPASIPAATAFGLVALFGRPLTDLDGGYHERLIIGVDALAFAARHAADVRFVDFDVVAPAEIAADPVAALPDHARPQLVQNLERRFVNREAKLPLELHGGNSRRHRRDQIGAPKPRRQGRVRALHHSPDRQGRLLAALPAGQDAGPRRHAERLALGLAMRANEAFRPLGALKIGRARGIVREKPLEIPQGLGERQMLPLEHVGVGRHLAALPQPANRAALWSGWHRFLVHEEIVPAIVDALFDAGAQIPAVLSVPERLIQVDFDNQGVPGHGSVLPAAVIFGVIFDDALFFDGVLPNDPPRLARAPVPAGAVAAGPTAHFKFADSPLAPKQLAFFGAHRSQEGYGGIKCRKLPYVGAAWVLFRAIGIEQPVFSILPTERAP